MKTFHVTCLEILPEAQHQVRLVLHMQHMHSHLYLPTKTTHITSSSSSPTSQAMHPPFPRALDFQRLGPLFTHTERGSFEMWHTATRCPVYFVPKMPHPNFLPQINMYREECILPGRNVQTARSGHSRDNAGENSSCKHEQHAATTISLKNYSGQKATKMQPKHLITSQFP